MSTTKSILSTLLFCSALSGSLDVTKTGMSFDKTTFSSAGELFVASTAAPSDDDTSYGLSWVKRSADDATGANKVTLQALVPSVAQVNGLALPEAHPLKSTGIHWLSSYGSLPLAVVGSTADSAHTVVLVNDPENGRSVIQNTTGLYDAAGKTTTTIKAAVAGDLVIKSADTSRPLHVQGFVMAAVTPNDSSDFNGQADAGVAVLSIKKTGLEPVDATGLRASAKAAALANGLIQIGGTGSINGVKAMHWDATLQRLYIGLDLSSGGCAVVVGELQSTLVENDTNGYESETKLTLRPVIFSTAGTNSGGDWNATDYIVAQKDSGITIQHLGVMHASTGKSFLVAGRNNDKVYAVPLVNKVGTDAPSESLGALADISNIAQPARGGNTGQLLTTGSTAALVGGGAAPHTVQHMAVYGDSVYISCADSNEEGQGIFVSTALFNTAGEVTGWGVWERVGGAVRPVYGFGIDANARVRYVSGDSSTERESAHIADWGLGSGNGLWGGDSGDAGSGLVTLINNAFSPLNGGVHMVRSFVAQELSYAGWFDTTQQLDNSAVIGFAGRNKCVLAMTTENGAVVTPTTFNSSKHFGEYDLGVDNLNLGMLTSMAISRSTNSGLLDEEGWLFVGGTNGLAVRSKTDGDGWTATSSLDSLSSANGYRFIELKKADGSSFSRVRSIHTDANNLYVIDAVGLYRIAYDKDKFKDAPDALAEVLIASPLAILGDTNQSLIDFVIVDEHAFLATTAGLWTMYDGTLADIANQKGSGGWREVTITPGGDDSFGVCAQLTFVPGKSAGNGGVLYVLTADVALNVAIAYRVAIPNADVTAVFSSIGAVSHTTLSASHRYMTLLGQLRENFYIDGGFAIDSSSLHHQFAGSSSALVRVLPITTGFGNVDRWVYSTAPDLALQDPQHTIGGVVRDPATGTLLVPGIWGLRVLQ